MPFGKYEFLMVPFGLAQAPAYFQLLMNKVLKGLKFAMTYLDDIIIFSQDESQHLENCFQPPSGSWFENEMFQM